jgi:putative membrane protein
MWNCNNWTGEFPFGIGKFFWGFGPWGGLLSLLFLIFIIYLMFSIARNFFPKTNGSSDRRDSLEILKNRLAKGEITPEEYHRLQEVLAS